ncbi:hypothetical protein [Kitasatospora kazusensis]|uniref:hypothetical protein n=1 Tax=Kitasatospora kazusensis TaxID=407974 RepID=UPI0031DEDFEF
MEQPWTTVTGPGTIDDLIADALAAGYEIKPRTVHAWVAEGLLDNPARRGKGRGSHIGLYAVNQRKLFLLLLQKREEMPRLPSLALVPLSIWLGWGEEYVPTRQVRKALGTWLRDGRRNLEVARIGAEQMVAQMEHPCASETARARLVRLLAGISHSGRCNEADLAELEDAARAVFEPPSVFGASGLFRAEGHPEAAVTVDGLVEYTRSMCTAMEAVRGNRVDLELLDWARQEYRDSKEYYFRRRPALAAQVSGALAAAFAERSVDEEINSCGRDLLSLIGIALRRSEARRPS